MSGEPEFIVAWAAIVACIVATVFCATKTKRQARLFTSLTFFALGWAVLLPYYALKGLAKDLNPEQAKALGEVVELLPAYSGLLLTLAGGPLRRLAAFRRTKHDPGVGKHDVWVLHGLYFMVLPHVLAIPGALDPLRQYHGQIVMIMGTVFTVLGFFSILEGLGELTKSERIEHRAWLLLRVVTLLYVALELIFTGYLLPQPERDMSPPFKWAYAAFKLVFTTLFLFLVVRQTRPHRAEKPKAVTEPQVTISEVPDERRHPKGTRNP